MEDTWKKAEKKYRPRIEALRREIDERRRKIDERTREIDERTKEIDALAGVIAKSVVRAMLDMHCSLEDAFRTNDIPQDVAPSIWKRVRSICDKDPALVAKLTPLMQLCCGWPVTV